MVRDALQLRGGSALSRALRSRRVVRCAALAMLLGCADVLGIPSDPALIPAQVSNDGAGGSAGDAATPAPVVPGGSGAASTNEDGLNADGILPPGNIDGIDGQNGRDLDAGLEVTTPDSSISEPAQPGPPAPEDEPDAGLRLDAAAPPDPSCDGVLGRVAVDVVFIVDNSGSMAAETAAFESALPQFVASLERNDTDYRIVLLSRHRTDERNASEAASTSVCVAAPVSGLASCPAPIPVSGDRFFQYSVKIDATSSLQRLVQAFDTPDAFGVTRFGWSELLRNGAEAIFIEISDSDSALSASDFVTALSAKSPGRFTADLRQPGFVFHSVVGIAQKDGAADVYGANEPIELQVCTATGEDPDNAGPVYQVLSRSTGGLRQSICPSTAIDTRLSALATDVVLRSVRACTSLD
jgi:hypothetical protein